MVTALHWTTGSHLLIPSPPQGPETALPQPRSYRGACSGRSKKGQRGQAKQSGHCPGCATGYQGLTGPAEPHPGQGTVHVKAGGR